MLSFFSPQYDNILILGDINIDLFNHENPLSNCLDSFNFTQLINEPTRVTLHSSTLLDPIFTNTPNKVVNSGTINADFVSDHKLVFCDIILKVRKYEPKLITYRDIKNIDPIVFKYDILGIGFDQIFYLRTIDEKVVCFTNHLLQLFDIHAPLRTARITKPAAPWLTDNMRSIFKLRDKALTTFQNDPSDTNWAAYKNMRNYSLASFRREKKAYLSRNVDINTRSSWNTLRNMNVCHNKRVEIPFNLLDPQEVNEYFLSTFIPADENIRVVRSTSDFYMGRRYDSRIPLFYFRLVSPHEVIDAILSLKSAAAGCDGMTLHMLNLCLPDVINHITHIVNSCLERGVFPSAWKEAIVTPLAKNNNPTEHSHLRPISGLCILSKILEKIVYLQLVLYLENNKLFPVHQSGFRTGHSTTTALLHLTDEILRNLDKRYGVLLVLLDLSKAFDTVNHEILLSKLKFYGMSDIPLNFFGSYLNNRSQRVKTSRGISVARYVPSGVPQGSILGPLLFLIYTFDLHNSVEHCAVQTYADDTQLLFYFNESNLHEASFKINLDLANVSDYCKRHCLRINPSKCTSIPCTSKYMDYNVSDRISLSIDNTRILFSDSVRNLGVIFDCNLRFHLHINSLIKSTYMKMKLLYSNRHILNFKTRKKLCETLILSVLSHSLVIYYPCLDSVNKSKLQKLQNNCCRFIFGLRKYSSVSSKIRELKWLRVNDLFTYLLVTLVHRVIKSGKPTYLLDKLIPRRDQISRILRHNDLFSTPSHNSTLYERSFTNNAVKLFNSLPARYKCLSQHTFKKNVKSQLLGSAR
nr:unnamed protein product [Callosobruchus chinensis]CAH7730660.1 unnamed protein product [Callosobruchus chinensis]